MIDPDMIVRNRDRIERLIKLRKLSVSYDEVMTYIKNRSKCSSLLQNLQEERNSLASQLGNLAAEKIEKRNNLRTRATQIKAEIADAKGKLETAEIILHKCMSLLPNDIDDDVPIGSDASQNVVVSTHGAPRESIDKPIQHFELATNLHMYDPAAAIKLSGSRFSLINSRLAKLERSLAMFMLDMHTEKHGYKEISHPTLVLEKIMYGAGKLPCFKDDSYSTNEHWLIPTNEVALAGIHTNEILNVKELPIRYTSYSHSFRREAGAAGKDTKGFIRKHEFSKVELFSFVEPQNSRDELEKIVYCATRVLKALGLPYRIIELCSGDLGLTAKKTIDVEVWMPGAGKYVEVSSCSDCGDYQSRRLNIRYRAELNNKPAFVSMLNGTGLAVDRTLAAILENYQEAPDRIIVPNVLRKYTEFSTLSPNKREAE